MLDTIPVPADSKFGALVARRLNASRPISPAGSLAMSGPTGTGFAPLPSNLRERRAIDPIYPWKVFAVGKSEDVDHFFEIYIPDGSIVIGAKDIEVVGISETEKPKRFTFACETDVGERSTLHLVVYRDKEDESDKDEKNYKSVLAVNIEEYENDESVRAIIPIAELAVVKGDEYDKGKVVSQIEKEAIRIEDLEVPTDNVSIDAAGTKEGETATGRKTGTLQLAHFNDSERDSGYGLAQRLRADPKTGEISAQDGEEIMLVARLNGSICYIPLEGDGEDPEGWKDPCDHDKDGGEGGGVSVDEVDDGEGGGVGGVAGDGDFHPGDNDCNCD